MTRFIGHRFHEGRVEVYAVARTIPEALILEAALRAVEESPLLTAESVMAEAVALMPTEEEIATRAPHALQDADEAGPTPMSEDEARARQAVQA